MIKHTESWSLQCDWSPCDIVYNTVTNKGLVLTMKRNAVSDGWLIWPIGDEGTMYICPKHRSEMFAQWSV